MANTIRVLMTGGGTGGHIYPLIAVAEALGKENAYKADVRLRYFGSAGRYRDELKGAGISVSSIASSKWRRYASILNIVDIFKFFWGTIQSWWKIFLYMPDVAFSKGGPGALPVILMCRYYRIPVIIHESDAVLSVTTKKSMRFVHKLFLAFASAGKKLEGNIDREVVGNPTRVAFFESYDQRTAKQTLGLNPDEPLVLFLGGSQGAEKINDFVIDHAAKQILDDRIQIVHQTGTNNYDQYLKEFEFMSKKWSPELIKRYKILPYLDNLPEAIAAADLVVTRAGSGSIFETAAEGKPAMLIPLGTAAQGHQLLNAYEYAKAGACIIVQEENLLPHVFIDQIRRLFKNKERLQQMSTAAKTFSKPEAASIIAQEIVKLAL